MTVFLLAALVFALATTGMALGVLAGRPPPRRCGGGSLDCGACEQPCPRREAARRAAQEEQWSEP